MKFICLLFVLFCICNMPVLGQQQGTFENQPTGFIENKGQVHDQNYRPNPAVKYLLNLNNGMNVQLRANGFSYDTYIIEKTKKEKSEDQTNIPGSPLDSLEDFDITYHFHRIDIELLNANPYPKIIAEMPSSSYQNYYNAVTPEKGAIYVYSYKKATYKDIYPNIDLEFLVSGNDSSLFKYNFIVHPGGDPSQIKLQYKGTEKLNIKNGSVLIQTSNGNLFEYIPNSWLKGSNEKIEVQYTLSGTTLGFNAENYNSKQILIIDPMPFLDWGTYLGKSGEDYGHAIATDITGYVYVSGATTSSSAFATSGAFQTSFGGYIDAFVAKFSPAGGCLWRTYYGGSGEDALSSIAIDKNTNILAGGRTTSYSGIASSGAYQSSKRGTSDAFIVKLNTLGARSWGTYYGGSDIELCYSLAVDQNNNVLIAGYTASSSAIATTNAHQTKLNGPLDGFIAKFSTSGSRLWGTYYGGSASDVCKGISTDKNNNIIISGYTGSTTGIATSGSFQSSNGGANDVYIAKFNASGNRLWGTYYGGSMDDFNGDICVDKQNNILVTGRTQSRSGIVSSNAYQTSFGGDWDVFIVKIDTSGARLWSTYYGGNSTDDGYDICTDKNDNILITGRTSSGSAIATSPAHQTAYGGGIDGFITQFDSSGYRLWGTYYGGSNSELGYSLALNANEDLYITGYTSSTSSIATSGTHQTNLAGSIDAFIAKFKKCITTYRNLSTYVCDSFNFNGRILDTAGIYFDTLVNWYGCDSVIILTLGFYPNPIADFSVNDSTGCSLVSSFIFTNKSTIQNDSITKYMWDFGDGKTSNLKHPSHVYSHSDTFTVKLTIESSNGCTDSAFKTIVIHPLPNSGYSIDDSAQCLGNNFFLFSDSSSIDYGTLNYLWKFGDGDTSTLQHPTHTYHYYDTFDVKLISSSAHGCQDSITKTVIVFPMPAMDFSVNDSSQCFSGNQFVFTSQTTIPYDSITNFYWEFGDGNTSTLKNPVHNYTSADSFKVKLLGTSVHECTDSITKTMVVHPQAQTKFYVDDSAQCLSNNLFVITDSSSIAYGSLSYAWDFGDGNASVLKHPSHTYASHDTFEVKLAASSAHNCKDSMTKFVITHPMPVVNFSINDTGQCLLGNQFKFKNLTTIPYGAVNVFLWDFEDNSTSSSQDISHSYSNAATFDVKLTTTSSLGCTDSLTKPVYVHPMPQANFSFNDSDQCLFNNLFQINNTSSIQSGTLTYLWELGDGDTSVITSPSHSFSNPDTFQVTLHATSNFNCYDSIVKKTIVFPMPQAEFSINDSSQCLTGNSFAFTDKSNISSGNLNFHWEFGDNDSATIQNPIHSYTYFDSFTVTLITTSSENCSDTATHLAVVHPMPHTDYFIWDTSQCFDKNAFSFSNTTTIHHGNLTYLWEFGDGTSSTLKDPVHSYLYADTFDVHLIAQSDQGCIDSTYGVVYIHVHPQPNSGFSIDDSAQCLSGNIFNFSNTSTISSGSFSQTWYFGDGDTALSLDATHSYSVYDTLDVILLVVSDWTCKDSTIKKVVIHPMPEADFDIEDSSQCLYQNQFSFHDTSSIPYGSFSYRWDFGDLDTSSLQHPTHVYTFPDTFNVKLWVTSSNNCSDSISKTVFVRPMPKANFDINDMDQCLSGNSFSFTNKSAILHGTLDYFWSFGDGDTSLSLSPTHAYNSFDTFVVALLTISDFACRDSIDSFVVVYPMPEAQFSVSDTALCLFGNSFSFTDLSNIAYDTLSYFWDFGDNQTAMIPNPVHVYNSADSFNVRLLTTSAKGCQDSAFALIVTHPMPHAKFFVNDSSQCFDRNLIQISDSSFIKYGTLLYHYNFGDGNTSSLSNPSHQYLNFDTFSIKQLVSSALGCKDSFERIILINPMPIALFSITDSLQCLYNNLFKFNNLSSLPYGSNNYFWEFGDGDSDNSLNATHQYQTDDTFAIKLLATSNMNCRDSAYHKAVVFPMPTPAFSINDSTQCLDSNSFSFLNTSSINSGSMAYNWHIENNSFISTDLLNYHFKDWGKFPVKLLATSDQGCNDSLTQYMYVYPMPVSAFIYLNNCLEDTMYFYDSSYIDSGMIAQWYWNFGDTNRSSLKDPVNIYKNPGQYGVILTTTSDNGCSDDSTRFFRIHPHVTPNEITRASVENDEYIIIQWLPPNQGRPDYYSLQRSTDSTNWLEIGAFQNDVFQYSDFDVFVDEKYYWYRTIVTDSCDYSSLESNRARSILLSIDTTQAFPILQWTPYEFWTPGVERYDIETFNEDANAFVSIDAMAPIDSSLSFTDSFNKLNQKHHCYRVTAYRNGDHVLSHSNTLCTETRFNLFIPSAFTPNHDGLNDVFEPKGTYIISFEMSIYNRWGEKVFETNDINKTWDGTFNNRDCPMGAYYYQLYAKGTFTQKISKTGTVTLIR